MLKDTSVTDDQTIDEILGVSPETRRRLARAYELQKAFLLTLSPDDATCMWTYLDGADITELIDIVAPLSSEYVDELSNAEARNSLLVS